MKNQDLHNRMLSILAEKTAIPREDDDDYPRGYHPAKPKRKKLAKELLALPKGPRRKRARLAAGVYHGQRVTSAERLAKADALMAAPRRWQGPVRSSGSPISRMRRNDPR